jgi:hypothetical protein
MADHRGRWQAQGQGLEESEAWNQPVALSAQDGENLLSRLESKIGPNEAAHRAAGFRKARDFIERARRAGGIHVQVIRSFTVPNDPTGRRVDLEVRAGSAFVP